MSALYMSHLLINGLFCHGEVFDLEYLLVQPLLFHIHVLSLFSSFPSFTWR